MVNNSIGEGVILVVLGWPELGLRVHHPEVVLC